VTSYLQRNDLNVDRLWRRGQLRVRHTEGEVTGPVERGRERERERKGKVERERKIERERRKGREKGKEKEREKKKKTS